MKNKHNNKGKHLYSEQSEKNVLACLICDSEILEEYIKDIDINLFYLKENRCVFKAIIDCYRKYSVVDLILICEELKNNSIIKKSGGEVYLDELVEEIPTTENIEHYISILKNKYKLRKTYNISKRILDKIDDDNIDNDLNDSDELVKFLDKVSNEFNKVNDKFSENEEELQPFENKFSTYIKNLEKRTNDYRAGRKIHGFETGFKYLDEVTGGLQKGDLIILGARTGYGKSDFGLNVINNGILNNKGIILYSLEMTHEQIMNRLIANQTFINNAKLRDGNLTGGNFSNIMEAVNFFREKNFFINDNANITINKIEKQVNRLTRKHNIDLIVIDYLQLITPEQGKHKLYNRTNEIGEISWGLKKIAFNYNVPVLAMSQLSRHGEQRKNPSPILSDLRDSGNIEQDANIVIFIDKQVEPFASDNIETKWFFIVAKNRTGITTKYEVNRDPALSKFYEIKKMDYQS